MGKYGPPQRNENEELLIETWGGHGLIIGRTIFPHKGKTLGNLTSIWKYGNASSDGLDVRSERTMLNHQRLPSSGIPRV
jgi:hypothetical protein